MDRSYRPLFRCFFLSVCATLFVTLTVPVLAASALEIVRMTPEGDGLAQRHQIVFTFDREVIPLGRMERRADEIPVTITPAVKCQWRWLARDTLACLLDSDSQLQPGTRYRVVMEPGIQSEDGATLAQAFVREFGSRPQSEAVTEPIPQVTSAWIKRWLAGDVPEIGVRFNVPVTRRSVAASFRLASGVSLRISAKEAELTDARLQSVLAAPAMQAGVDGDEAQWIWYLTPTAPLGEERNDALHVAAGLASPASPRPSRQAIELLHFTTFAAFRFIGLRCVTLQGTTVTLEQDTPAAERASCDPMKSISLRFSAPVSRHDLIQAMSFLPDLAGGRQDYDPWRREDGYYQDGDTDFDRQCNRNMQHQKGCRYSILLPTPLKAFQTYRIDTDSLKDSLNRPLPQPLSFSFATDHRAPKLVLDHTIAVLEKGVASELPVVVNNLSSITSQFQRLTASGGERNLQHTTPVPALDDIAFTMPLGLRELLKGGSGAINGYLSSSSPAEPPELFAQVTPWQVHAKLGHHNSLVWVVDLATGQPVANADVTVYEGTYSTLATPGAALGTARTDARGIAMLAGTRTLDPQLNQRPYNSERERFFVRVVKADDQALLPLDYHFETDYSVYADGNVQWRDYDEYDYEDDRLIRPQPRKKFHHIHSFGSTAQGIYRLGDTVQYKIWARDQDNKQFVAPPTCCWTLKITDPQGNQVNERSHLSLNEFGAFDGDYTIPASAPVGWYEFTLAASFTDKTWQPMRVLVADFTPASFRVGSELNGERFSEGETVTVKSEARLHAGGPYADANLRVTASLRPSVLTINEPAYKDFYFSWHEGERDQLSVHQSEATLDAAGDRETQFELPRSGFLVSRLTVESAVQDDRGKSVAGSASALVVSRDRFVGLRSPRWTHEQGKPTAVEFAVINEQGKAVAGDKVQITVQRLQVIAARVKGAGNAYLTQYQEEWLPVADCAVVATVKPGSCGFTPPEPGEYRFNATVSDGQGREHRSELWSWATGKGEVVWKQPDDNSLSVIAQQQSYKIGDKARFLVKNSYPGAMALITIERYGVMRATVQLLEGSTPIVSIPITADDVPGFYLSIMLMSPRVARPLGEGGVDLGKPTFKMAYRHIEVDDPVKRLQVQIKSDRPVYRPREKAKVELQVTNSAKGEPVELAVAVLDEAVFDLLHGGNQRFDPYSGFYHLDGLDLRNYSLLMRLVGRQKFEKKGASPGGDGGLSLDMRTLFKYVSYWQPSLRTDANGKASISVDLPDNLTGWRVLAMAVNSSDRMGLGVGNFKVNQPIELRPVMPNQLTEGDKVQAGFSVMNRSEKAQEFTITLRAEGPLEKPVAAQQKLMLAPYKRETVWLPLSTRGAGTLRFTARASAGAERDALSHELKVQPLRSLVTAADYGSFTEGEVKTPIEVPADIYTDVGKFSMVLSPSVIGNVDGAFSYLKGYLYGCWEQRLTKALMAAHYRSLHSYLGDTVSWPEAASLPQELLDSASQFQAASGGMSFWTQQEAYVNPYLSAYTALAFQWLKKAGYQVPQVVDQKLNSYLDRLLRENIFPGYWNNNMAASVRSVVLAARAESGRLRLTDLQRFRPHLAQMDIFGKAHFLQAALKTQGGEGEVMEASRQLLASASQSGGKFQLSEQWNDAYAHMLATPLRSNCAALSALTQMAALPAHAASVGDIPFKMVRAITQARGARTHWENTQENLFCLQALVDYSKVYEATAPDMKLKATIGAQLMGETRFTSLKDKPVTHSLPLRNEDAGARRELVLSKEGPGRVYYSARLQYASTTLSPVGINAGFELRREYQVEREGKWQLLTSPMQLRRGELVRVDLFLFLPTARHFVVVDDPVPGGLEPVNRDLATSSTIDADKGEFERDGSSWYYQYNDWHNYAAEYWSFYHRELRFDAARFYADYLSAGRYHLSYTAQVIAEGEFRIAPTHVEEMYDPDVFGKSAPGLMQVGLMPISLQPDAILPSAGQ